MQPLDQSFHLRQFESRILCAGESEKKIMTLLNLVKKKAKIHERTSPCPLETLHRCCIFTAYNMDLDAFRIFSALDFHQRKSTLVS